MRNKIYFIILLSFLTLEVFALARPCLLNAKENNAPTDIMVSYKIKNSGINYIKDIKDNFLTLKKKTVFKIKAEVEPVTESEKIVYTRKTLDIDRREIVCIDTPCHKKWEFNLNDKKTDIMDLSHLILAWSQEIKENSPEINVSLYLQKNETGDDNKKSNENDNDIVLVKGRFCEGKNARMVENSTLDLNHAEYVEKSKLYLAKRELGFHEDKRWRYSMDGDNLVLQSRVDIPLKDAQVLKIYCTKGSEPVRVSLSIDKDGDMDRDMFIQFEQMDKTESIEYGKKVLTLDFSRALRNAGVDIKKGHLLEPIIFMHQNIGSYKRDKPLKKIVFGIPENKSDDIVSPGVSKSGKMVFLNFDFGKSFNFNQLWNFKIKKIVINADFNLPQIFAWKKVMLCSSFPQLVPSILLQPEIALQKWAKGVTIAPKAYLQSFKPLLFKSFRNIKKKSMDKYGQPEIKNTEFHDKNMAISVSETWYNLKKHNNKIDINGIFSGSDSQMKIVTGPFAKPIFIKIKKKNIDHVIVKQSGSTIYNLPFNYLSENRGFYLDREKKLTLLVKNEPEIYTEDNEKSVIKTEEYKKWQLSLYFRGSDALLDNAFKPVKVPFFDIGHVKDTKIIADNPVVNNRLLLIYHGNKPLKGNLEYFDVKGKKTNSLIFISKDESHKFIDIEKGSRLVDFKLVKLFQPVQGDIDLAFLDLKTASMDTSVDKVDFKKLSWWDYKAGIKLKPAGRGIKVSQDYSSAVLYRSYPGQNQWIFTLDGDGFHGQQSDNVESDKVEPDKPESGKLNPDKGKFLKPDNIKIDPHLPFGCSQLLVVNGKIVDINNAENNIGGLVDLRKYSPVRTLLYKVKSHDNKKILQIKIPEVNVTGVKHTAEEDAGRLRIKIGNKIIPVFSDLLLKKHNLQIPMGKVEIDQGKHFIEALNSKYFRIKSLILETDSSVPLSSLMSGTAEKDRNAPSFMYRLLIKGIEFALFAGFIFILYLFRQKIKPVVDIVWNPVKKWLPSSSYLAGLYWFLPDEAWVMLWFLGGAGLYGLGLMSKSRGENYAVTFGGIFMVVFLWHFGRLLKGWLLRRFPKIADSVYANRGSMFFAWAIVLLVITAVLVALKLEPVAEQTAIVVYYCLVVGVVGEVLELKKNQKNDKNLPVT